MTSIFFFLRQHFTVQMQVSLKLMVILPRQPPECWDYRCVLPHLTINQFLPFKHHPTFWNKYSKDNCLLMTEKAKMSWAQCVPSYAEVCVGLYWPKDQAIARKLRVHRRGTKQSKITQRIGELKAKRRGRQRIFSPDFVSDLLCQSSKELKGQRPGLVQGLGKHVKVGLIYVFSYISYILPVLTSHPTDTHVKVSPLMLRTQGSPRQSSLRFWSLNTC